MAEAMEIRLRTLTPLWTGGAGGKSDRVHVTGIVGSLRWWYEALVRGLGGYACDPSKHVCHYDQTRPNNGLCAACEMFGSTGWSRRFRLVVTDMTRAGGPTGAHTTTGERYTRKGKPDRPRWYFPGPGRVGELTLSVIPLAPEADPTIILGLLELIQRHAGLAAKTQLGYGWVELVESPVLEYNKFVAQIQEAASIMPAKDQELPSLTEMFFAHLRTADEGLTAALNLRFDVRAAFRDEPDKQRKVRHLVSGTVRGERQGSKLSFSQAVNGQMRVWGWVPRVLPGIERVQAMAAIRSALGRFGHVSCWREYNSPYDSVSSAWRDCADFLTSLLCEEGA
jgi:CRISPR-associated protein Cmr1